MLFTFTTKLSQQYLRKHATNGVFTLDKDFGSFSILENLDSIVAGFIISQNLWIKKMAGQE